MKITLFLLLYVNVGLFGQLDTSYIELIPRENTFQFHSTAKDLSIIAKVNGEETTLFRNHNWGTGFYARWGRAELFVSLPIRAFDNKVLDSHRGFGTGFGLNFYAGKMHYNYNFKYIQGFQDLRQVRIDGLETLKLNNFFLFNRLNTHYVVSDRFSLRAALRFNDRQRKSAGSLVFGAPITYHYGQAANFHSEDFESFIRSGIGLMVGYGYTFVKGNWATSIIGKAGIDFRYSSFRSTSQYDLAPTYNIIASTVYHFQQDFIGIVYGTYPELPGSSNVSIKMTNWKARLYLGRRF